MEPHHDDCPLVTRPEPGLALPVIVSIPHLGTRSIPGSVEEDFANRAYVTFPWGYSDLFSGDVYADLYRHGAITVATSISRLFVDVNRRRDDFEILNGEVKSKRGLFRTHMLDDRPIFAAGLTVAAAEAKLRRFYDPFHETLRELVEQTRRDFGRVLLIDAHTGSPNGMSEHEVVIGTRHGKTAPASLVERARSIFEAQGFRVDENVSGYAGGYIVQRYSENSRDAVEALQIEINSGLLMTTPRKELIDRMMRGEIPLAHRENVARARRAIARVVKDLAPLYRPMA